MKKIFFALLFSSVIYAQDISFQSGTIREKNYYQEIPFEIVLKKIVIPVEIQNHTYHFILDTGAPNLISKKLMQTVNCKSLVKTPVRDANLTKDSLQVVQIPELQLGNLNFDNQIAIVSDLENNPFLKCYEVDGLIGSNLFVNSILRINLKDKKITITDKIKNLDTHQKPKEMQLIGSQSKPCIWIEYQGNQNHKSKEQVVIDTGMDGFYDLSNRSYNYLKKEGIYQIIGKSKGVGEISLFGTGEAHEQEQINIPNFKVNQTTFTNVTTSTHEDNSSRLGLDLFNYGTGILDFKNKKFYWESDNISQEMPKAEKYSATYYNNNFVTDYVWDSDLQTKIKAGDAIVRIDDKDTKNMTTCELLQLRDYMEDKKSYQMEVQKTDGTSVIVTINH